VRIRRSQILAGALLCAVLTFGAYTLGGSALAGEAAASDPYIVHSLSDVAGASLYFQPCGAPVPLASSGALTRMGDAGAQVLQSQADLEALLAMFGVTQPVSLGATFFDNHVAVAVAVRGAGSSPCRAVALQLAGTRLTAVIAPGSTLSSKSGRGRGQLLLLALDAQDLSSAPTAVSAVLLEP